MLLLPLAMQLAVLTLRLHPRYNRRGSMTPWPELSSGAMCGAAKNARQAGQRCMQSVGGALCRILQQESEARGYDTAIGFAVFCAPFQHSRACRPPLRICSPEAGCVRCLTT